MRHTYATIGLMSGAKPGFLAKQLGHGLRMFFTVYAKWISSSDDDLEMENGRDDWAHYPQCIPEPKKRLME
ncbi:phage integrase-like catalytic core domain-containing protein [Janthinobacterium sp. HH01]|nr:phage integrase-like catalytic core domain-containing protein [Janthinobacterium sp. HH01]